MSGAARHARKVQQGACPRRDGTRVAISVGVRAAFWSYVIVVVTILATGVLYCTTRRFLPYHAEAFGQPWEQTPERTRALYLVMVKAIGAPTFVAGTAIGLILVLPWRRRDRWALFAVPALALAWTLPMLGVALSVRWSTGAATPWPVLVLLVAVTGVGALASARARKS